MTRGRSRGKRSRPSAVLRELQESPVDSYLSHFAKERYIGKKAIEESSISDIVIQIARKKRVWHFAKASIVYAHLGFADYALFSSSQLTVINCDQSRDIRDSEDIKRLQKIYESFRPSAKFKLHYHSR